MSRMVGALQIRGSGCGEGVFGGFRGSGRRRLAIPASDVQWWGERSFQRERQWRRGGGRGGGGCSRKHRVQRGPAQQLPDGHVRRRAGRQSSRRIRGSVAGRSSVAAWTDAACGCLSATRWSTHGAGPTRSVAQGTISAVVLLRRTLPRTHPGRRHQSMSLV